MGLAQALKLAAVGVLIGLAGSLAVSRTLSTLLYGVRSTEPAAFASVALLLVGVAVVASLVPARRAARVDPMVALRHD
jgi:putative ABC transport system permease protein